MALAYCYALCMDLKILHFNQSGRAHAQKNPKYLMKMQKMSTIFDIGDNLLGILKDEHIVRK